MDAGARNVLQGIAFSGLMWVAMTLALCRLASADETCQEQVRVQCSTCHFVTYICPRIEKDKGALYWKGIVADMVKEGLQATDEERKRLVHCLAFPDPGVRALCQVQK